MQSNPMRAALERGELQLGTWINLIRNPAVLPLLKAAGLDFARYDIEHSSPSMETVANMAVLARALDFALVVRPPKANREWITRLLDIGVWNLHCPQVETAEQAAEIVAAAVVKAVEPRLHEVEAPRQRQRRPAGPARPRPVGDAIAQQRQRRQQHDVVDVLAERRGEEDERARQAELQGGAFAALRAAGDATPPEDGGAGDGRQP